MGFGNPVMGKILPSMANRTGLQFGVTRTFATHKIVTPGGLGLDIANQRCNDPVLAMADGTVIQRYIQYTPGYVGHGARIIRIAHAGGWSTGYAHLSWFAVAVGQQVKRGQKIGTVGNSGASSCHLHFDTQRNDVHYDPWLMLDQNIAAAVPPEDNQMTIVTYTPFPDGNRKWTAGSTKKYTGYKPDGSTKIITLSAGSTAPASGTSTIEQNPQKSPNGSGWVLIAEGALAGYYVLRTDGTVAPGSGDTFSRADVDRARKEGAAAATKAALEFTSTLP